MSFRRLGVVWVVFGHVALVQHRPSYVVTCFDGLDLYGLDCISADRMHPLDGFFCELQAVYDIGLLEIFLSFLCWIEWLPLPVILGQWYAVSATFISLADENGISWTFNQHILFFIQC